jgi:acyl-CoA synthetase (AMP-forming)/AMP-acid ligase II
MAGGWCVNPVNLLAQPEQMRYVLEHSDCRVIFVDAERETLVRELLAGLAREVALVVIEADALDMPATPAHTVPHPAADALALLMYTSGTTGRPKGVMLTQSNLIANALAVSAEHTLGAHDRVLAVLPLYHINAFTVVMLAPLAHGGSLVMAPRFSAARFWSQALDNRCTWLNVVPTMVSYLLESTQAPDERVAAIRFCRSASAPLPTEHLRWWNARNCADAGDADGRYDGSSRAAVRKQRTALSNPRERSVDPPRHTRTRCPERRA